MLCNLQWFKQFKSFANKTADDFFLAFEFLGLEPKIVSSDANLNHKIVVAQIIALKPHPIKDNLTVCQVTTNQKNYQIICGGSNLVLGAKIILALPKAILFDGTKINKTNFAGIRSEGMICALYELMPNQVRDNRIAILPQSAPIGDLNPLKYASFNDVIWSLEFTLGTQHLQNLLGLCHYLALYWKINFTELPLILPIPSSYNPNDQLFQNLPKNELVIMVALQPKFALNTDFQQLVTKLGIASKSFWFNLQQYFQIFSGCTLEFAAINSQKNYDTIKWSSKIFDQTAKWLLIRCQKPTQYYQIPLCFSLATMSYLYQLLKTQTHKLFINQEIKIPAQYSLTLPWQELNDLVGINFNQTQIMNYLAPNLWKLTFNENGFTVQVPIFLPLYHPHQLIEEILRFHGFQTLPSPVFKSNNWPTAKLFDQPVQLIKQIQQFFINAGFTTCRAPFSLRLTNDPKFYQLPNSWLKPVVKLVTDYQKPLFHCDTVWNKIENNYLEQQELLLVLTPIKKPLSNKVDITPQYQQLARCQKLLAQLLTSLQIPLKPLFYQPVNDHQNIFKIGYIKPNHLNSKLAEIGFYTTHMLRNVDGLFAYLKINYDYLFEIVKLLPRFQQNFVPIQKIYQQVQKINWFDFTVDFIQPLSLINVFEDKKQRYVYHVIHSWTNSFMQIDKRIQRVEFKTLFENQHLTLRIYWRLNDPALKSKLQTKLLLKITNYLKTIKNVKI